MRANVSQYHIEVYDIITHLIHSSICFVNETIDYVPDRFPSKFECLDDCNVVAKKTAAKEHVIISMDAVFGPCQL